jgi:hypothetical protein
MIVQMIFLEIYRYYNDKVIVVPFFCGLVSEPPLVGFHGSFSNAARAES